MKWVKLAKLIPRHQFEEEYATSFTSGTRQPDCSFQMAQGTLFIKECYQFSDEEMVAHITMNPYLQYFIGLEAFTQKSPFNQSMMTRFRKRISTETLQKVNDIIIGRPTEKEDNDKHDNGGSGGNSGTLILDATYAPQNIRFPSLVLKKGGSCANIRHIVYKGVS